MCIPCITERESERFRHFQDGSVEMPSEFSFIALNKGGGREVV